MVVTVVSAEVSREVSGVVRWVKDALGTVREGTAISCITGRVSSGDEDISNRKRHVHNAKRTLFFIVLSPYRRSRLKLSRETNGF